MIYLHVMRFILKLIKFFLAFFVSAVLLLLILFFIYKDRVYEEIRLQISKELSTAYTMHINIGSIKHIPPYSLSMDHITLSPKETDTNETQAIDNVIITPNLNAIIKNKRLNFTIDITNFHYKTFLLSGIFRIMSTPAKDFNTLININNIESISILTADMLFEDILLENMFGTLHLQDMSVSTGKLQIPYENKNYSVEFNKTDTQNAFAFSINSNNLGTQGIISIKNTKDMLIKDLEGMFYTFRFNTDITISDYLYPKRTFFLTGKIETDLNSFSFLPGEIGKFFQDNTLTGKLYSDITIETKDLSLSSLEIDSDLSIKNLSIKKLFINNVNSSFSLKNGKISTTLLTASLYNGFANCELEFDLYPDTYPFLFSTEIRDIDYKSLMTDLSGKKSNINGKLFTNLIMDGHSKKTSSYKGTGNIAVITANLGKMPILTPLLGDMYSTFQEILPGLKTTTIREASADFSISNRKIRSDNITFLGDDITINGWGYMDFDGNLNFDFEHKILDPENANKDEEWQTTLRNVIVNLGKLIKKTHLGGTVSKPKWSL